MKFNRDYTYKKRVTVIQTFDRNKDYKKLTNFLVFLIKTLSAEENLQFFLHWLKTRKLNKMEVKCENSQQRRPEIDCFDEIVVLLSQSLQN